MDIALLAKEMDRCWLERRFDDLGRYVAEDAVLAVPDGSHRVEGLAAISRSYREFMAQAEVLSFESSGHAVTERGDAAVVEYRWHMVWRTGGAEHDETGREILVLSRRDGAWRVIWRTQVAG